MKNNIDFLKINNGRDGVINLNNMIPIPYQYYYKIDINEEIKKDKKYGLILKYQIIWCNKNLEKIIKNAEKLYFLVSNNKANLNVKRRCCNFKFLETKLNQFILNQEKSEQNFKNPRKNLKPTLSPSMWNMWKNSTKRNMYQM